METLTSRDHSENPLYFFNLMGYFIYQKWRAVLSVSILMCKYQIENNVRERDRTVLTADAGWVEYGPNPSFVAFL